MKGSKCEWLCEYKGGEPNNINKKSGKDWLLNCIKRMCSKINMGASERCINVKY